MTENMMIQYEHGYYNSGSQFYHHLKDTLKELYDDAIQQSSMKMMTVALYCHLARPGYVQGIQDFINHTVSYYSTKQDVWICTRAEIAQHWYQYHYPIGLGEMIQPWYMNQNHNTNTTASSKRENSSIGSLSTLETLRIQQQQQPSSSSLFSSSSKKDTNKKKNSMSSMFTTKNMMVTKPPEEALGENDII
jgi:hypothetical protein